MIKIRSQILTAIVLSLLSIGLSTQKAQGQDAQVSYQSDGISYQTFYDQLSPYGQWVSDPQFGNVWVPNVAPGFRPYANDGHWAMTDQGNMWVSGEPWAWAAYHYGRWTYNPYYGWVWIPGYEWAPAWVSWRNGGGYYGWAPMGPGSVYGAYYDYPSNYWVFVNPHYLYQPNVYNYYERGDMGGYITRTQYVRYDDGGRYGGGARYYGPPREDLERATGQPMQVYRISNAGSAGAGRVGGNEISIYRPPVNRASASNAHPSNVIEGRDHPIGSRPEPMSANHESFQPAFRQDHPQQQQQQPRSQPQQQPQQRQQQFQQPQQRNNPQQQRGGQQQQQGGQQPQQQQRGQQQRQQQQRGQQQRGQQRGGQQQPKQRQEQEHK